MADREHTLAAALQAQQRIDVLVELAIGKERALVGADRGDRVVGLFEVAAWSISMTRRSQPGICTPAKAEIGEMAVRRAETDQKYGQPLNRSHGNPPRTTIIDDAADSGRS